MFRFMVVALFTAVLVTTSVHLYTLRRSEAARYGLASWETRTLAARPAVAQPAVAQPAAAERNVHPTERPERSLRCGGGALSELWRSTTAARHGIPNVPAGAALVNLRLSCPAIRELRERVPDHRLTSGFRSAHVNAKVGGSPTSRHLQGLGFDVTSSSQGRLLDELEAMQRQGWPIDEIIVYPGSHVHFAIAPRRPGHELLIRWGKGQPLRPLTRLDRKRLY